MNEGRHMWVARGWLVGGFGGVQNKFQRKKCNSLAMKKFSGTFVQDSQQQQEKINRKHQNVPEKW